jgi:protein TonB
VTAVWSLPAAALLCAGALAGANAWAQAAPRGTAQAPVSAASADDPTHAARREIERLKREQRRLLAQLRREIAQLPVSNLAREDLSPEDSAREIRRRELVQSLAEFEKRVKDEDRVLSRTRYLSAVSARGDYLAYYNRMCHKIERQGTADFPTDKDQKLYGTLVMNITINVQGEFVKAEVVRASESRVLDERAVAIVRAAAPFGPFNAGMRREADQIVVTSKFRFVHEEGQASHSKGCQSK